MYTTEFKRNDFKVCVFRDLAIFEAKVSSFVERPSVWMTAYLIIMTLSSCTLGGNTTETGGPCSGRPIRRP